MYLLPLDCRVFLQVGHVDGKAGLELAAILDAFFTNKVSEWAFVVLTLKTSHSEAEMPFSIRGLPAK
jgi:hypothetical protein